MAMSEVGGQLGKGSWGWGELGTELGTELGPLGPPVVYPPVEEAVGVKAEVGEAEASTSGEWEARLKAEAEEAAEAQRAPDIGGVEIRNVVCAFNLRCHVPLRDLAVQTSHVYYERSKGVLVKQMREPKAHIKVWSSGKVAITGAVSEEAGLRCARKFARLLQRRVAPRARFAHFRVSNILATAKFPFGVRVEELHRAYPKESQYEPELMVGLIWRQAEPKAVLRVHTTGSVTLTGATSAENVREVLRIVYPILKRFSCERDEASGTGGGRRKRKRRAETELSDDDEGLDDHDDAFLRLKQEPDSDQDDDASDS